MEKKKAIKLGIFILIGFAALMFALFYIGSQENLFTPTIILNSDFETVSGLTVGNAVRFAGINVGTVNSIQIIGTNKIRIKMTIKDDVKKFIKKDAMVSIDSEGLIGNKVVAISAGSDNSPEVIDGDFLLSVQPVDIGDIINNLNESTKQAEFIAKDLASIMSKVESGEGTLGALVNDNSLYVTLDSTMKSYASITGNVNRIIEQVSVSVYTVTENINSLSGELGVITTNIADITKKINSSESLIGTLLTDTVFANNLKSIIVNTNNTTANLERGAFGFYQNMEALKHNFLFKGYFEDLGYWDKSEWEQEMDFREARLLQKEREILESGDEVEQLRIQLRKLQEQLDVYRNRQNNGADTGR